MIGKSDKQEFLKPAIHVIFFGEYGFFAVHRKIYCIIGIIKTNKEFATAGLQSEKCAW